MLDLTKPITVPIISGGEKRVRVNYPSDAEWCERAQKQSVIRHFLGRNKSRTDEAVGADRTNAELLARIRVDTDGPELTDSEATLVIQKLERARVEAVERSGSGYRITLRTSLGQSVHDVRIPTAAESIEHERRSTKTTEGRRNQEIRGFLEPSGELYDRVKLSVDGYGAGPVPIVHKVPVVMELLAQIAAVDEELLPEV